jgi:stearoyl-CoA desaturase (delta-9 desaturase)
MDVAAAGPRIDTWWYKAGLHWPAWHFWSVHLAAVAGVAWLGWSWWGLGLAVAFYYLRMFFISAAYHRYFSHRTFQTSRPFQFFMAVMANTSTQGGVFWWASHHRRHHRYSDGPEDVHSAKQYGFLWSHMGWLLSGQHDGTDLTFVPDLVRQRELAWLEKWAMAPAVLMAVACLVIGGPFGLVWGFFVSTVLLWHGTFTINSLSHKFGRRRYPTTDESRNSFLLALVSMGEGYHNNHHRHQASAAQGFYWYEVDLTQYVLRVLNTLGIIWDLRAPPLQVLAEGRAFDARRAAPPASEVLPEGQTL